jgi:prepilin-type N-terminal cleavage/methylation domain-containing protein
MIVVMKDSRGFTVVEIIVALLAGSIMAGSAYLILTSHVSISQRARDLVLSNAYAENKMESLRSAGFLALSDGTNDITAELPSELKAPHSGSLVISTNTEATKKAVLTITYNDQGATRTYTYTTLVGELGVGQY